MGGGGYSGHFAGGKLKMSAKERDQIVLDAMAKVEREWTVAEIHMRVFRWMTRVQVRSGLDVLSKVGRIELVSRGTRDQSARYRVKAAKPPTGEKKADA